MRTIIAHFFTTINLDMALNALNYMFNPTKWLSVIKGKSIKYLENEVLEYIKVGNTDSSIISFYNGRSAIYHGIKLLGIGAGDEIIMQAFTCVSVSNSIIQTGAMPIYCDIDKNNLNIDPAKIESLISPKTKAILVQHTFGIPCDIYSIKAICKKHDLYLIEDCAHAIGAEIDGTKVGNFGDIAIFSFGRDKVISCVNGGFLMINNNEINNERLLDLSVKLINLPISLVLKNLLYVVISFLSYRLYDFYGLGKFIIFISRKLSLIPEVLSLNEKQCKEQNLNYKLPNCLAEIGLSEFKKIDEYNKHRIEIADIYYSELSNTPSLPNDSEQLLIKPERLGKKFGSVSIFLRCPFLIEDPKDFIKYCKEQNVLLGDWYRNTIDPIGTNLDACMYKKGSCSVAEDISSKIVNLPNHYGVSGDDAKRVLGLIRNYSS